MANAADEVLCKRFAKFTEEKLMVYVDVAPIEYQRCREMYAKGFNTMTKYGADIGSMAYLWRQYAGSELRHRAKQLLKSQVPSLYWRGEYIRHFLENNCLWSIEIRSAEV